MAIQLRIPHSHYPRENRLTGSDTFLTEGPVDDVRSNVRTSANAVIGGLIHQRRQCVGSRRPGGNGLADRLDVVAIICKRDFAIRLQKDGHQERNMITIGLIISWDAQSDQWSPLWSRTPVSSDRVHGVAPTSLQWRVCLAGTRKL